MFKVQGRLRPVTSELSGHRVDHSRPVAGSSVNPRRQDPKQKGRRSTQTLNYRGDRNEP